MIRKVCIVDGPIYVMVISDLLLLTSFPNLTNPIHLASGLRGHPSQSVGLLGGRCRFRDDVNRFRSKELIFLLHTL